MKLATLCYIKANNKILLLHRNKKPNDIHEGKYVGLGGKIQAGESPEECVIREVKEESGLTITNPKLKGIVTFPKDKQDEEDWYVFIYLSNNFEGKLIKDSPEGKLEWLLESQLPSLPMWQADKTIIDLLNKPGFFSAKFIYKGEEVIKQQITQY